MWWRIISRSFRNRKARLALATLSVILGANLVAALTSLSLDIPRKAGSQLRSYGANIFILPQVPTGVDEAYISERDLSFLDNREIAPSISSYTPYLYSQVEVDGQRVILAGARLDSVMKTSPWWQVRGSWPRLVGVGGGGEAMAGSQVVEKMGLQLGENLTVRYQGSSQTLTVVGIVSTGAAEENQVFVDLGTAQKLTGLEGKVGLVQVSALTQSHSLSHLSQFIEQGIPGTEARIVGQIAKAESQILSKVQLLMALVAALILIASGLVVLSTMTTTLLERTPEIGLMNALGASDRRIAGLFGVEIGIIALGGGLIGYLLGYILAQFIGHQVFGSSVSLQPVALLVTLAIAIIVTLLGSTLPLRRAMKVDPALTLRGE